MHTRINIGESHVTEKNSHGTIIGNHASAQNQIRINLTSDWLTNPRPIFGHLDHLGAEIGQFL